MRKDLPSPTRYCGVSLDMHYFAEETRADTEEESAIMKRTFQPKKCHRAKKHGFLSRSKSKSGRHVLAARRSKGRVKLAA